jgi:aromatic ring-opening dioxygenase catalytic subunit (LigB family)
MMDSMAGVYQELARTLREIPAALPQVPKAVVVITAHWIERSFAVSGSANPSMIYDYSGFPKHTYSIKYAAPGSPEVAKQVHGLLEAHGLATRIDQERGFDHGTYTILQPMFPDAKVPVVQVAIDRKFDPEMHLSVGRALASLRSEGILLLGSGLSFHNLGLYDEAARSPSTQFDRWLQETMGLPPHERSSRLRQWSSAPSARVAHPREDHLLPLMVAVGAAESESATLQYHEDAFMGGWCVSSFRIG